MRSGGLSLLDSFEQNMTRCIMLGEPFYFGSVWGVPLQPVPRPTRKGRLPGGRERAWPGADCSGARQVAKFLLPEKQRERMHFLGSGGWGDALVSKTLQGKGGAAEAALRKLPTDQDIGGQRYGDMQLPSAKMPWEDTFRDSPRADRYREAEEYLDQRDL